MKRPSKYRLLTRSSRVLLVLVLLLVSSTGAYMQSRKDLEKQRREKEKEIAETKKLLSQTTEKKKQTFEYMNLLAKQIKNREDLIGTLEIELRVISNSIDENSDVVDALDKDLAALKAEYAQQIFFLYKNQGSYNMLAFVFSSQTFNQAYRRLKFIQFYTNYRKKQVELIQSTQTELIAKVTGLQEQRNAKLEVLKQLDEQKASLEADKSDQAKLMQNLKGQEANLRKQLKQKQAIADKLDRAIKDIIAKEIAEQRRKARKKHHKQTAKTEGTAKTEIEEPLLTPEESKLSADFAGNRSKLPWPVESGRIAEHYGIQNHPTMADIHWNNNGIKITTKKDASARVIFNGEVRAVISIPGANQAVIVMHGNYYTVYSNLKNVSVKAGQKVKTKEAIGSVAEDRQSGEPEMELEIWQGANKLNPENWIFLR